MQDTVNNALWLPASQAAFNVAPAPYTAPRGREVVVRTRALALNPFDRHLQTIGSLAAPWLKYPMVVGHDLAFKPSPPCRIAGHGLEGIPAAMAMHAAGVSAAKLVVTL